MANKEEIRPIYSELQGYLSQAPKRTDKARYIDKQELWKSYNSAINELEKITGSDYERYKIQPTQIRDSAPFVVIDYYRSNLGGIIARLHGEYFSDEPAPFSGMPSTSINLQQQQSQSVQVEIVMEIYDLIHEKLSQAEEGTPEKTFLEKIKGSIKAVRSIPQFISLLFTIAKECGLNIEQLKDLFT